MPVILIDQTKLINTLQSGNGLSFEQARQLIIDTQYKTPTDISKEEAVSELSLISDAIGTLISIGENVADIAQTYFSYEAPYGMGGSYDPEENEWHASSHGC